MNNGSKGWSAGSRGRIVMGMRRRSLLGLLAVVASGQLPLVRSMARAEGIRNKVVVIGIDGAMYGKIQQIQAPNLLRLGAEGTVGLTSIVPHISISGPSWSTVLTGVWDRKHGVTDNNFDETPFARYPSVFTHLAKAGRSSASIASWDKIAIIAGSGTPHADLVSSTPAVADDPDEAKLDAATATAACVVITRDAPDFLFVHLDQVDYAGHGHGAASTQYLDATGRADFQVGRIAAAVHDRALAHPGEQWTILITTDHGHLPGGGHGGQTRDETGNFVIAHGPQFAAGISGARYSLVDITPTVLDLLEVPLPPDLDGISMLDRPLSPVAW